MKCVCGYEKEIDYIDEKESINPDGEDFISISGVFFIDIPYDKQGYFKRNKEERNLYACPKCGTIKIGETW